MSKRLALLEEVVERLASAARPGPRARARAGCRRRRRTQPISVIQSAGVVAGALDLVVHELDLRLDLRLRAAAYGWARDAVEVVGGAVDRVELRAGTPGPTSPAACPRRGAEHPAEDHLGLRVALLDRLRGGARAASRSRPASRPAGRRSASSARSRSARRGRAPGHVGVLCPERAAGPVALDELRRRSRAQAASARVGARGEGGAVGRRTSAPSRPWATQSGCRRASAGSGSRARRRSSTIGSMRREVAVVGVARRSRAVPHGIDHAAACPTLPCPIRSRSSVGQRGLRDDAEELARRGRHRGAGRRLVVARAAADRGQHERRAMPRPRPRRGAERSHRRQASCRR